MSILQVSNIHFESTGNNRLQYTGSNSFVLVAAGSNAATITTTGVSFTNTNLTLANVTSTTNTFTIGTAAYFISNGNFGIGNTAPANKLSVNGTGYFGANVTVATSVAANVFYVAGAGVYVESQGIRSTTGSGNFAYRVIPGGGSDANAGIIQFTNAAENSQWGYIYHNSAAMGVYNNVNGTPLYLGTNSTAKMVITATGNVGIGTLTPGYILSTSDSSAATRVQVINTANNSAGIYLLTTNTAGGVTSDCTIRGVANVMSFFTAGGNERLTIISNGNIGIACNTPGGYRLAVEQNGSRAFFRFDNSNASSYSTSLDLGAITGKGWSFITDFAANTSDDFSIYQGSAANRRFVINSSGNIGVGRTSPVSKLHIEGSASGLADTGIFELGDSSRNGISFGYDTSNNWGWIYSRSVGVNARPLYFNYGLLYVGADTSGKVVINAPGSYRNAKFQVYSSSNIVDSGDGNGHHAFLCSTDNWAADKGATLSLGGNGGLGNTAGQTGAHVVFASICGRKEGSSADHAGYMTLNTMGSGGTHAERMRIDSVGRVGIGVNSMSSKLVVKNDQNYQQALVSLYQYSGASSSPAEAADWPNPVLSLRSCGDFYLQTMLSMGLPNDPDYQTDNSVWNFRLNGVRSGGWDNNVGTQKNTSDSGVGLELLGPGNLRMGTVSAKSVYLRTNNADRVQVNDSGYVTLPYQPVFCGQGRSGGAVLNTGGESTYVIWNPGTILVNRGSHFNTSTGRYTCPVAGVYKVSCFLLCRAGGAHNIVIYKNGAQTGVAGRDITSTSGNEQNTGVLGYIDCAANDILDVRVSNSGGDFYHDWNSFTISLFG